MKKRALLLAALAVCVLTAGALGGCGRAGRADYAMLTDEHGVGKDHTVAAAWNGVCLYAQEKGAVAAAFMPDAGEAPYRAALERAQEAGVKTIVGCGRELETVFHEAQAENPKTRFVLIGGVTRDGESGEADIADNTICIDYAIEEQAFLAGYGAVAEGYTHLAFMAGEKTDAAVQYEAGFLSGIEAAAQDLGIPDGNVEVKVSFAGSDELSPVRMGEALELYDSGTQVIMTVGEGIRTAVLYAAERREKPVIAADSGDLTESPRLIMGTAADSGSAVEYALAECDEESFTGGVTERYGTKERSIRLVADFSSMESFTQDRYETVYSQLANGALFSASSEITEDLPLVTVTVREP